MPEKKRVVPWTSNKEFVQVAECVYSCKPGCEKVAMDIMNMWRSRVQPSKIPRSIICTSDLLNSKCEREQGIALSLMRFVSLISGEEQDRNKFDYVLPVYSTAQKIGIPSWIVDLRNEIAHNALPKLPILQAAHNQALEWLKENFWQQHVEAYHDLQVMVDTGYNNLVSNLIDYQQLMFKMYFKTKDLNEDHAIQEITSCICSLLTQSVALSCKGIILLLSEGYLIPSDKQLKVLKLKSITLDNDLRPAFSNMWLPLLLSFKDTNLIPLLINKSFQILIDTPRSTIHDHLHRWCKAWLKAIIAVQHNQSSFLLCQCLTESVISKIEWSDILHQIIFENMTPHFAELAQLVICSYYPPLSEGKKASLSGMCQFVSKSNSIPSVPKPTNASDLYTNDQEFEPNDTNFPLWSTDSSLINWTHFAFGSCPGLDNDVWNRLSGCKITDI